MISKITSHPLNTTWHPRTALLLCPTLPRARHTHLGDRQLVHLGAGRRLGGGRGGGDGDSGRGRGARHPAVLGRAAGEQHQHPVQVGTAGHRYGEIRSPLTSSTAGIGEGK